MHHSPCRLPLRLHDHFLPVRDPKKKLVTEESVSLSPRRIFLSRLLRCSFPTSIRNTFPLRRVAGDSFTELGKLTGIPFLQQRQSVIASLAFCIMLPLTLPTQLSTLAFLGTFSIFATAYTIITIIAEGVKMTAAGLFLGCLSFCLLIAWEIRSLSLNSKLESMIKCTCV